jgi:hypothetical protein
MKQILTGIYNIIRVSFLLGYFGIFLSVAEVVNTQQRSQGRELIWLNIYFTLLTFLNAWLNKWWLYCFQVLIIYFKIKLYLYCGAQFDGHFYNPIYSGGGDWEDWGWCQSLAKCYQDTISINKMGIMIHNYSLSGKGDIYTWGSQFQLCRRHR